MSFTSFHMHQPLPKTAATTSADILISTHCLAEQFPSSQPRGSAHKSVPASITSWRSQHLLVALAALWAQLRCAWSPEGSCSQSSVCSDGAAAGADDGGDDGDDAIVLASSVMPGGYWCNTAWLPAAPAWEQHRPAGGTERVTQRG